MADSFRPPHAPPSAKELDYLGDGVYVGHDGYHVMLWLGDGGPPGRPICMEPSVLAALDRYRKRIAAKYEPDALRRGMS